MNREFLKEAIADAKAVKESAIANAKSALEEAFTPHLKTMLSAKLQEMEKDEDIEENDVMEAEKNDKISEETHSVEEDDMDLDEILSELEKDNVDENERTNAEEEGYLDGMKDEKKDLKEDEQMDAKEEDYLDSEENMEAEEINLEDMTDDDLKKFIEDVIEDMVTAGEIKAGDSFEDEASEDELEVEDEVEVEDVEIEEGKKPIKEVIGVFAGMAALIAAAGGLSAIQIAMEDEAKRKQHPKLSAILDFMEELGTSAASAKLREEKEATSDEELAKLEAKLDSVFESKNSYEEDDSSLEEAYSTIKTLRTDLNEINLLNAKLLYTNKIFKSKNLNENDKVKILTNFDKAETVQEAKLIYDTLVDFQPNKSKNPIKENLGRASKYAGIAPNKGNSQPIIESNQMVDRFKKLAGII
jgi:hypothetical protein